MIAESAAQGQRHIGSQCFQVDGIHGARAGRHSQQCGSHAQRPGARRGAGHPSWPVSNGKACLLFVESASAGYTGHGHALAVLIYEWHLHTGGICTSKQFDVNAHDF